MRLIEENITYIDRCPKDDTRIMFSNCCNCQYYERQVINDAGIGPGQPRHEKLFCKRPVIK